MKIPRIAAETWCGQINKYIKKITFVKRKTLESLQKHLSSCLLWQIYFLSGGKGFYFIYLFIYCCCSLFFLLLFLRINICPERSETGSRNLMQICGTRWTRQGKASVRGHSVFFHSSPQRQRPATSPSTVWILRSVISSGPGWKPWSLPTAQKRTPVTGQRWHTSRGVSCEVMLVTQHRCPIQASGLRAGRAEWAAWKHGWPQGLLQRSVWKQYLFLWLLSSD